MEHLTKEQQELHQLADECIEESLKFLLEGNLNLAKGTASRARDTYKEMGNKKSAVSPYVTVSQGYSSAYPEPGDTIETMINLADLVLYSVKRRGRNGYNYTGYKDILKL